MNDPGGVFDEAAYLAAHSDIRAAVQSGQFASGEAHYEAFGRREGRALRLRLVRNRAELGVEIDHLRGLLDRSLSEWLRARSAFAYAEDTGSLPADPLSAAYRERQLALYAEISGKPGYDPWASEPEAMPASASIDPSPYPFNSQDGELIAGHLYGIGHIFYALWQAKPGTDHSILEYGCGVGFTTVMLAASGFRMTAVDINDDALANLRALAAGRRLAIRTHCGEFGAVPVEGERFDVILFYEAFHHCLDFVPMLRRLHDRLAAGGILVFAGEPVYRDFPKPWGLRLDGASLWEIRERGWLELGFREDFFVRVLEETGWRAQKTSFSGAPDIWIARPIV